MKQIPYDELQKELQLTKQQLSIAVAALEEAKATNRAYVCIKALQKIKELTRE